MFSLSLLVLALAPCSRSRYCLNAPCDEFSHLKSEYQILSERLAASEAARKELDTKYNNLIINAQNREVRSLKQIKDLERDKARLDWLQKVYTNDLKRFGMAYVVLDWNYNQLRNAIDAAMEAQGTKGYQDLLSELQNEKGTK